MKAMLYPSDKFGCGHYRINLPGEVVAASGEMEVEWGSHGGEGEGLDIEKIHVPGGARIRPVPVEADVLILQRVAHKMTAAALGMLQDAGYAVVMDIDDDLTSINAQHPAFRQLNPKLSPDMNWDVMAQVCAKADLVTVPTPALAKRYAKHGRVAVLPNCISEHLLDLEPQDDGNTIGWAGFTPTHPGDLRVTGGGVAECVRRGGRYLQVGPPVGVQEQLGLGEMPEFTGGIPDIEDYYKALTRLTVGIVPLLDNRFNESKSYLKGLEYIACGVPFVASPVGEYRYFKEIEGFGLLAANRGRNWRQQIEALLRNEELHAAHVSYGYHRVKERHTIEGQAWRWAEAWAQARTNADKRMMRKRVAA